ncbi:hypothetical protein A3D88_01800 [Candidatus Peribacteria bacterium RIFCSPHIGHO2_02_FULL_52_16]|nr:MAG: hypothetical protein A2706_04995 [Candidatus Peribacteria bacterium RIFCSPHIGHO2_01_FULL_51_35]OGJ61122.1 MAG: hypothetical protein A3D88_01800 [Candidatus Peribacteria bacterium RIFCSPHIGHO2_02_FULL_52_16]
MPRQQELFGDFEREAPPAIPGLRYLPQYISQHYHDELLNVIDGQPWETGLTRRVQQYGWRYDYDNYTINPSDYLGPLPSWGKEIAERLVKEKHFTEEPDQLIVNEYIPGQGISGHRDKRCFGETVASLSLGSQCMMDFYRGSVQRSPETALLLEPNSMLILDAEARTQWGHGIKARKSDLVQGVRVLRTRRVSLTLRTVVARIRDDSIEQRIAKLKLAEDFCRTTPGLEDFTEPISRRIRKIHRKPEPKTIDQYSMNDQQIEEMVSRVRQEWQQEVRDLLRIGTIIRAEGIETSGFDATLAGYFMPFD